MKLSFAFILFNALSLIDAGYDDDYWTDDDMISPIDTVPPSDTFSPIDTVPPTDTVPPAPTSNNDGEPDCVTSVLELTTDTYPDETSWNIKNDDGVEKYNGTGYTDANTLHTIDMCLAPDDYSFYITDTYGDGICCDAGNGGYVIKVANIEVVNGGEFATNTTESFNITAATNTPTTPAPSPVPTAPACGSDRDCDDREPCTIDKCENDGVCSNVIVCSVCGGVTSVLELKTDTYPGETSWNIKNFDGVVKYNGTGYTDANTLHTIDMCLAPDKYYFYITDTYGDGICCSFGDGYYMIKVANNAVVSGGEFATFSTESFTVTAATNTPTTSATSTVTQTNTPTSEPTFDPTQEPTFDPTQEPTFDPTQEPTFDPTQEPTFDPSPKWNAPTDKPIFINGFCCPYSNVVFTEHRMCSGSVKTNGKVCANDGQDNEAYCIFVSGSGYYDCAYCKGETEGTNCDDAAPVQPITAPECGSDPDCDDGEPCTIDKCENDGVCSNVWKSIIQCL